MAKWWEDPINQPQTPEEILRFELEQIEQHGQSKNRGSEARKIALRASKTLDKVYGKDRKHG
ncbi:hypothetical protein D3C81_500950 [compost metagenome]